MGDGVVLVCPLFVTGKFSLYLLPVHTFSNVCVCLILFFSITFITIRFIENAIVYVLTDNKNGASILYGFDVFNFMFLRIHVCCIL